jgi:lipoate-protein ligase A
MNTAANNANSPTPQWYLLESGPCPYDYNMALDHALMEAAPQTGKPVLRFYGWTERAASFGYSQKYSDIERITMLRPLVRRPTGGGLVPHDADWTYSLAFPAGHFWYQLKATESYQRVHEWIRDAFAKLGVTTTLAPFAVKDIPGQCFIGAEKSDLLWRGRKIAGAAQRRTHQGLLIQGSVQPPPLSLSRTAWHQAMCQVATEQLGVEWTPLKPEGTPTHLTASLLAEKYSQASFNQRR